MKQAFLPITVSLVAGLAGWQLGSAPDVFAKPVVQKLAQQAVETDVHEFMEHYNQPIYRRLKEALASDPDNKDRKKWSKIADDSLLLAEVGNLLFLRGPQQERDAWLRHAVTVREAGSKLYHAAKQQNGEAAKTNFNQLINNCNQCHKQFAGGEHMLEP
jgi:hypothetical protein